MVCSDTDATGDTIEFVKISGDTNAQFTIDSSTGILTTTSVGLDYETIPSFSIIFHAIDNSGGTRRTATATVSIDVGFLNKWLLCTCYFPISIHQFHIVFFNWF